MLTWSLIIDASLVVNRDVLQPDISYTAYNTICYLVAGVQYRRLCSNKFETELISRQSSDDSAPSTAVSKSAAAKKRKRLTPDNAELIEISD